MHRAVTPSLLVAAVGKLQSTVLYAHTTAAPWCNFQDVLKHLCICPDLLLS